MKTAELIAFGIRDALRASPRTIGAHLSPIGLSPEDVVAALRLVRKRLGSGHYLVGSAPDMPDISEDRLFCARDERAAERATFWRNRVRVGDGERLVYVSVEEHGKASGLLDCLEPVSEEQIAEAFLSWCDDEESGLPAGTAAALRQGRVVEGVQLEDLCAFATAFERDPARARKPWEVIGKHLPLLSLARDSALGGDDTAERLRNNAKLVRALASGEDRRRSTEGALVEVEAKLVKAFNAGEDLRSALGTIDLGSLETSGIAPKGSKGGPRAGGKGGKGGKGAPEKKGKKGRPEPSKGGKPGRTPPEPVVGQNGASKPSEGANGGKRPGGDGTELTAPKGGQTGSQRPRAVTAPALSQGVELLLAALLGGDGAPVEAKVRAGARQALVAPPRQTEARRGDIAAAEAELAAPLAAWRQARVQLVSQASGLRAQSVTVSAALVGALPRLLADGGCAAAFETFAHATVALYLAAQDASERAMREVLALDTAAVRDADGVSVRVIGPLHLLWFGQALERSRLESEAASLSETARRALVRARSAGPTSPAEFPEGEGADLALSRPEDGLIVFERVPEVVERASLSALGSLLVRRYLALAPHASLGCRVAFEGEGAESFIDGVAEHLMSDDGQTSVEVLCERPPSLRDGSDALLLVGQGRIRLGSIPMRQEGLAQARPHIAVRVPSSRPSLSESEPSSMAVQSMAPAVSPARTRFELRERSLRIVTSVEGVAHLEAFEALHAAARGRRATRAFVLDASGLALRSEVDVSRGASATWHVVIAPSLGNRPPMGAFLLAHERIDDRAVCAVLSREVRVAMRAVQDGLARAGLNEEQPKRLKPIAMKLAQTCGGGLLSLRKDNVELLAGALLSLELSRRIEGRGVVVPVSGRGYEALTGDDQDGIGMQAAFGIADGTLRILVGVATLDASLDIDLSVPQVGGAVGARLHAVVSSLQALRGEDLLARAARDAVGWLVWPTFAGMEAAERPSELIAALSDWASVKDVRIEVHALLPPSVVVPKGRPPKVSRCPFTASVIDVALIKRLLLSA
ncbi:MAG: hypothetical protein JWM10_732 [Myxococcaceae bacterium]|nr:hypothetical protein [Myxococcaceae bacterium]